MRPPRWQRRITWIALGLLAAMLLNYPIEWFELHDRAFRSFFSGYSQPAAAMGYDTTRPSWGVHVPVEWPAATRLHITKFGPDSTTVSVLATRPCPEIPVVGQVMVSETGECITHQLIRGMEGFPFHALETRDYATGVAIGPLGNFGRRNTRGWEWRGFDGGMEYEPNAGPTRVYPVRPMWPGFALNGVVYFLVLLPFALGLRAVALRLWPTRAPNRCTTCGYDLAGLAAARCPECGTALGAQPVPTTAEPRG